MKIAVLVYEYPPKIVGGLGTYAAEITRKFVLMDHDVTVFTMNDDAGTLPTREIWRGIEIHRPLHIDVSDSLPDVIAEDVRKWGRGLHLFGKLLVYNYLTASKLINELIKKGKLKPGESRSKVTFHDPCNLGRMNAIFEDPRQVLQSAKGLELIEMKKSRCNSFCCGGGGANVWYQVPETKKIGMIRVEEAIGTGAETIAVACPFCITMFEDAAKSLGSEKLAVKDIAEIIAETLPKTEHQRLQCT